ncbi:MAG TPA: hypothetical protein VGG73_14970 [Vicinamibacterales bacterium]
MKSLFRPVTMVILLVGVSALGAIDSPAYAQAPKPPAKKAPAKPPAKAPAKTPDATPPPAPKPPPPIDVSIESTYTTGDKTATSVASIKGARRRIEYGNDLVTLQECDIKQTLELNGKTLTYLATPFEDPSAPLPPAPVNSKGGQITYTTTVTDTGEKKDMFGYPARHLVTVVTKEASPTACNKKPERIETDGWYVDFPEALSCTGVRQTAARVEIDPKSNCRDEIHFVRPDTPVVGYPVAYTMTATGGTEKPAITTLATSSLKTLTIPASSFELPDGYLEVKNTTQLMADHRPGEIVAKKPGVIRVGVVAISNRTDQPFDAALMSEALGESLSTSDFDIVTVTGASAAAVTADAKTKDCDYLLETNVTELKKPGKSMLGKISGTSGEAISAKVDYTLVSPGLTKPALTGSDRSGTSTLQTAVGAAKRVAQFVAPLLLAQYSFMNTFSAMNGGASAAALGQTSDPVLNNVFKLLDRASGKNQESYSTEEAALAAAMEKEVAAVFAELQKRKK